MHTRPAAQDKYTAVQDTLLRLSSSMNEWNNLAAEMKALDSLDIARDALAHNRAAQAIIKKFEAQAPNFLLEYSPSRIPAHIRAKYEADRETPTPATTSKQKPVHEVDSAESSPASPEITMKSAKKPGTKGFNLISFAIENPLEVEIFRKNFHRGSGKPLFKPYKFNIIESSNHTLKFDNNMIIRKSDISIKVRKLNKSDLTGSVRNHQQCMPAQRAKEERQTP